MIPLTSLPEFLPQFLTALTIIIVGGWAYEARDGFFLSFGSFRGKVTALVIVAISVAFVVIVTPMLTSLWQTVFQNLGLVRLSGISLILGMLAVNSVTEWNYTDSTSALIYIIGLVLLLHARVMAAIPISF